MKIVELNMLHEGSTGKIMLQIAQSAREAGHQVKTFSARTFSFQGVPSLPEIPGHSYFGSYVSRGVHTVMGILTGGNGLFSIVATWKLLREIDAFSPDLIHLHNLHQFCINLPMLFRYIKKKKIRVVWTLHDCWAFTGHCAHFDYIGCEKWKTGCSRCPQHLEYPKSYVDHSKWLYKHKKKWFCGVEDMTLVTPSRWLADFVKQSYLKDYPVKVIHNGIDLSVFKPRPSDFRQAYGIPENRFILLGVAFGWGQRKGLDVFVELAGRLDPENYQIVLVGTDDAVDKLLPENIISIHRTQKQTELAEIYTAADLFVNPTREENYPTVNMEAIACGTPVLTFRTGGSPEIVDECAGAVVARDDIDAMEDKIKQMCKNRGNAISLIEYAKQFEQRLCFGQYVEMFAGIDMGR